MLTRRLRSWSASTATAEGGGANGIGTVYEIAKIAHGYASTPTTLVSFNGTDGYLLLSGLIADAQEQTKRAEQTPAVIAPTAPSRVWRGVR